MGLWGTLFFSKKIAQLEAFAKTVKNPDCKRKLEEAIEALKAEENEKASD